MSTLITYSKLNRLFKVLETREVNTKLKLLNKMRIYLVFYKLLLKLAPLNAKLETNVKLKNKKYKVKEIKNLKKFKY